MRAAGAIARNHDLRRRLIAVVHADASRCGLTEAERRALQQRLTGVRSCSDMNLQQLRRVAAELHVAAARVAPDGGKRREPQMPDTPKPAPARGVNAQPGGVRDISVLLEALDRRLASEADAPPVEPPAGYRADAKGRLVPDKLVRDADRLEDDTVRRILAFAVDLANQIARFRAHTFDDLATLLDLLGEQYGRKKTARTGGYSCASFDSRLKVQVQISDRITFGPELQHAKAIIDECVADWSADARPEVLALIQHAFATDKHGHVNREGVFRLRRLQIDDARWRQAQQAIADSIRVEGAKSHIRLYMRPSPDAKWKPVPISLAADWVDPGYAPGGGAEDRS